MYTIVRICLEILVLIFSIKSLKKRNWCMAKFLSLSVGVAIGSLFGIFIAGYGDLRERSVDELSFIEGQVEIKVEENRFYVTSGNERNGYLVSLLNQDSDKRFVLDTLSKYPLDSVKVWYYNDGFESSDISTQRYAYQVAIGENIIFPLEKSNAILNERSFSVVHRILSYEHRIFYSLFVYLIFWEVALRKQRERFKKI